MKDFKGSFNYRKEEYRIDVKVEYKDKRLSIAGDIYERRYGSWQYIGGGQCYEELLQEFPLSAWLVEIWIRWHLNDMRAGDEQQEAYIRALKATGVIYRSYEANCNALDAVGLLEHNGYKYGSAWKFEPVPIQVLNKLKEKMGI